MNTRWLDKLPPTDSPIDYQPRPSWRARLRTFLTPRKDDTSERLAAIIERHLLEKEFGSSDEREG